LYQPAVHVPLVIAGPGIPRGIRVARAVSLREIPRTVLDFTGARANPFPGGSLRAAWEGTPGAEQLFSSMTLGGKRLTAVRDSDLYLIRRAGKQELYNLKSDPREAVNLAGRPEWQSALAMLEGALDSVQQHSARQ
jgi:choline-sulfatase